MQLINMYSSKQRTGVLDLEAGLEAYIIPPCTLVDRLLKTAKKSATLATHMATSIPDTIADVQLLLVVIHRKVFAHMQQLAMYSNLDEMCQLSAWREFVVCTLSTLSYGYGLTNT